MQWAFLGRMWLLALMIIIPYLMVGVVLADTRLKVGYRTDAAPFVYLENGERTGFLHDLCQEVLVQSGLDFEWSKVEAGDRISSLSPGPGEDKVDLLCDPLTVTLERSKTILFSPILFVSGGSYLEVVFEEGTPAQIAYLKGRQAWEDAGYALAHDGATKIEFSSKAELVKKQQSVSSCEKLRPGQIGSIRVGVIEDSTAPEIISNALLAKDPELIKPSPWETVCYKSFDTHKTGIEELCKGVETGGYPLSYYFGDRDILLTYLRLYGDCPNVVASNNFLSVEPYALGLSERVSREQYIKIQNALLRVFSEPFEDSGSTLPFHLFWIYFEGSRPSSSLTSAFTSLIVPAR